MSKRKTRADLVKALRELQTIIGQIGACYGNDRQPDRAGRMHVLVEKGFAIAVDALATDPPEDQMIFDSARAAGDGEQTS